MKAFIHKHRRYIYPVFFLIFAFFWGSMAVSNYNYQNCLSEKDIQMRIEYCKNSIYYRKYLEIGADRVQSAYNYTETAISLDEGGRAEEGLLYLNRGLSNLDLQINGQSLKLNKIQKSTFSKIVMRINMLDADSPIRRAFYDRLAEFGLDHSSFKILEGKRK